MKISEIKVSYSNNDKNRVKIKDSQSCYDVFLSFWNKNTLELQEEFKVLLLNNANQVLGIYPLSKGGTNSTVVDVKILFSVALKSNATSIIIAHNHPSENLNPSEADKRLTQKIKEGANYLDIKLLDHLIITKGNYYSFADNQIL